MLKGDEEQSDLMKYSPIGLFFFGLIFLFASVEIGVLLIVIGWFASAWMTYQLSGKGESPITAEYKIPESSSRLLALLLICFLIKYIILIPHIIVLWLLGMIVNLISILGIIMSLFGAYPKFIRDMWWGTTKWGWRCNAWIIGLTDTYPPFDTDVENYPTELRINYDLEGSSRSTLLTFYGNILGGKALLMIPRIIIWYLYGFVSILAFIVGPFVVLFTGSYPASFLRFSIKVRLQQHRIMAYVFCLTEVFPPLFPEDAVEIAP